MKLRKTLCILVLLALVTSSVFALVACNPDDGDPANITFVLDWAPNTNHTGLYVAKHLGYYAEEGLNVTFVQPGTTGSSADVSVGVGQFGIDFQEQMIYNQQSNVNVTAVAAVIQHNTSGILVKGTVDSLAELKGKKYATWGLAGEQSIVKHIFAENGLSVNVDGETSPSADKVNFVPNTVENIMAEFANPKGVDCLWSYQAWDVKQLEVQNVEHTFFRMSEIDRLDYYTPVIIANNDYLKNYPEQARKFIAATAKGYEYAIANPREAADILMEENPELKVNAELVYASMEFLKNEYTADAPQWGYIDQQRWDDFFALMWELETEGMTAPITAGYGFTNEFLPSVSAN